jgi:patatin-related protein
MNQRHSIPPVDYEELRLAVVMNGGVSLAVWIGGVTTELNRAMRGEGLYGELLELTATAARVDVISGTSAGGINGALLALARAYDADVSSLRDVWLERGSLDRLLQSPYEKSAASLLKGNARFFDDLRAAFADVRAAGDLTSPAAVPVDLTLTTTMLHGVPNRSTDDFGVPVGDMTHQAQFHFRRGEELEEDAFADARIAERLALASRATASFPIAFEPIYCPVRPEASPGDARLLDMANAASFQKSRFLLDGGILDNKPLESAIDAVLRQRVTREVRRVLVYVVPRPGLTSADVADAAGDRPTLSQVTLASLIELPRVESISAQLRAVKEHNQQVRRTRDTRMALVRQLGAPGVRDLARRMFDVYRRRRAQGAVEYICDALASTLATQDPPRFIGRRRREWIAQRFLEFGDPPWIPAALPTAEELRDPRALERWGWGSYALEHLTDIVFDLLRRSLIVAPLRVGAAEELRGRLKERLSAAYELSAALPRRRRRDTSFWARSATKLEEILAGDAAVQTTQAHTWVAEAIGAWSQQTTTLDLGPRGRRFDRATQSNDPTPLTAALGRIAWAMAALTADALDDVEAAGTLGVAHARTREDRQAAEDVLVYVQYFRSDGSADAATVLARLLAIEVVQYATGAHRDTPEQFMELVQISANATCAFGGPASAADKLAGAQLGNFGGFYKKAWRANDWMYGRLDAADRVTHIMLNPARLSRLYAGRADDVVEALREIAVPGDAGADAQAVLQRHWQKSETRVRGELAFLNDPTLPVPEQLPACAMAVVAKLHLDIIREELRVVVAAAQDDRRIGAGAHGPSADLIAAASRIVEPAHDIAWDTLPAERLLALFRTNAIGQERFADELGSDLFTSRVARSLAVAASLVAAPGAGLGPLARVLRAVRLPILIVDGLAQNAVSTSRASAFASGVAVSLGAVVVVLLLFTSLDLPLVIAWVGSLVFVASVALALRRSPRLIVGWLIVCAVVWGWMSLGSVIARHLGP